jgi:predicted nucleic-acid-binding protein
LKERKLLPIIEEKQIMDGLLLVLMNGWTIQTQELIQFFDLLDLKNKVEVFEANYFFIEFVYVLAKLLKVEMAQIKSYFSKELID